MRMVIGGSTVVGRLLASCPSSVLGGRGTTRAAGSRSSSPQTSLRWFAFTFSFENCMIELC